jgi:hypothetical protein
MSAGIIAYVVSVFVVGWSFFLILWFALHRVRDSDEWNAVCVFLIPGVAVHSRRQDYELTERGRRMGVMIHAEAGGPYRGPSWRGFWANRSWLLRERGLEAR